MADRRVSVNVDANVSPYVRAMAEATGATKAFQKSTKDSGPIMTQQAKQVDRLSGRMQLLGEAALTIGPAFIPLGAAAIPVLAGMTAGLAAAATGAGVAVLAFQGLGDGLKALNTAQLDPTQANLDKLHVAMVKLGPDGAHFVRFLDSLSPSLSSLQMTARAGLFPGLEDGIQKVMTLMPQVRRIIASVSQEMGDLASEAGGALAGPKFSAFFNYIETDAAPTLHAFAEATGNVVEGIGNLIVAMAPLSRGFASGLESMTAAFAQWTDGLSKTQGFQDFVSYIQTSGPMAADFLGALASALIAIVKAAAPWGQIVLPILTDFAKVIGTIADSPVGPALFATAAGFVALNRAVSLLGPSLSKANTALLDLRTSPNMAATAVEKFGGAARMAAGAAGVGLFINSIGQANKTLGALEGAAGGAMAGFSVGGPWGAAIGGAIGLVTGLATAHETASHDVEQLTSTFDQQTGAITNNTRAWVVQKAQQDGLLTAAESLGIKSSTVTDAILGNASAQRTLQAATEDLTQKTTYYTDDLGRTYKVQTVAGRAAQKLQDGVAGLTNKFGDASSSAQQFARGMSKTGDASRRASADLAAARDAARTVARGFITLGKDVNNAKVSLGGWIKQLQNQADALNHFTDNALRAAHKGLDQGLIASLKQAGPEGALRMRQLANGTENEIARANRAWQSGQDAIRRYANMTVPPKKITVDGSQARATLAGIQGQMNSLHDKSVTFTVYSHHVETRGSSQSLQELAHHADGGYITGPGGPRDDKIPAMLSNGEFVVNAAATARNLPTLFRMNAQKFADGGIATTGSSSSHASQIAFGSDGVSGALKKLKDRLEEATKAVDKEKAARDNLLQARSGLVSSVAGNFRSDIFAAPSDIWGASNGGALGTLRTDIANARKFRQQIRDLKHRGLDGGALAAITTLDAANQIDGMSTRQLRQYESLYKQRQRVTQAAGVALGDSVYGAKIDRTNTILHDLKGQLHELQVRLKNKEHRDHQSRQQAADRTGEHINRAARPGNRGR